MAEENENASILYIGRFLSSNYFGASWYSKIPAPKQKGLLPPSCIGTHAELSCILEVCPVVVPGGRLKIDFSLRFPLTKKLDLQALPPYS
jgi:hypothetical protein